MPVVVPSAPEVQETTRMLEDSESVSVLLESSLTCVMSEMNESKINHMFENGKEWHIFC